MLKSSAHGLWNQTASESRSDGQVGLPWVSSKEGTISTCLLSSPRARTLCSGGTTESDINTQQLALLLFFPLSSSLSPRSQFRDFKSLSVFWNAEDSSLRSCSLLKGWHWAAWKCSPASSAHKAMCLVLFSLGLWSAAAGSRLPSCTTAPFSPCQRGGHQLAAGTCDEN